MTDQTGVAPQSDPPMEPPLEPAAPSSAAAPTPGERRLAHPPSDRYRAAEARAAAESAAGREPDPPASVSRGLAVASAAAVAGAVAIVWLGAFLTLTSGLLAVAGLTGGAVGLALRWGAAERLTRGRRATIAIVLAIAAVGLGQVGIWQYALAEGGVLPIGDYLGQVYGPLVPAEVGVAAIVAWLAGR